MMRYNRVTIICVIAASALFVMPSLAVADDGRALGVPFQALQAQIDDLQERINNMQTIYKEGVTIAVPKDYPTIQEAIDAAGMVITIQVASGLYNENLTFSKKSIQLIGAGRNTTILNGAGSYATISMLDSARLYISGLTIKGDGDGIFARGNCHLELRDAIIEHNTRDGIRMRVNSSAVLFNSILRSNSSNGLFIGNGSSAEAHGCTFSGNDKDGILVLGNSSVSLDSNEMNTNGFSGLDVSGNSHADLWSGNNIFDNNTSGDVWSGIGIYHNSSLGVLGEENKIYGNNGPGIKALMKSHFYFRGIIATNEGNGVELGWDSSADVAWAKVQYNEGFGVSCDTNSFYLGPPSSPACETNTLGCDSGNCSITEP